MRSAQTIYKVISCTILRSTAKAYQVRLMYPADNSGNFHKKEFWVPISQTATYDLVDKDTGLVHLSVAEWILKDKGCAGLPTAFTPAHISESEQDDIPF